MGFTMKYMIMTLLAVGCGSDEAEEKSTEKTEVAPEGKKVVAEKPAANVEKSGKEAAGGHEGMDHGKVDAGAHIGPVPEG